MSTVVRLNWLNQSALDNYNRHESAWRHCVRCQIGELALCHVFARGTLPCEFLFIGEAPGKDENRIGLPFVGMSGDVLNGIIEWVYSRQPFHYAITNTVACRPTNYKNGPNRQPTDEEQSNCANRFDDILTFSKAQAIILLGHVARDYWLGKEADVVNKYPMLELPHPSRILRSGKNKQRMIEDSQEKLLAFVRSRR